MAVSGKFLNIDDSLLGIVELAQGTKQPLRQITDDTILPIGNEPNDYAYIVPDGYIVLDFDTDDNDLQGGQEHYLKEYMNMTTWFRTNHGYHFWFKLPRFLKGKFTSGVNVMLTNGMICDIKVGGMTAQNTVKKVMVLIRSENIDRECHNPLMPIPEIPVELYPIKYVYRTPTPFTQVAEGGRNDFFFKLVNRAVDNCKELGYYLDEITAKKICEKTNKYIQDPMSPDEFDKEIGAIIQRAFSKETIRESARQSISESSDLSDDKSDYYDEKGKLIITKIAEYIQSRYDLYYYRETLYLHEKGFESVLWLKSDRSDQNHVLGQIIYRRLEIILKMADQKDIYDKLIFMIDEDKSLDNDVAMPIVTKNGYVIKQDGSIAHDYSVFSTNVIDTNYNPDITSDDTISSFLDFITEKDTERLGIIKFMLGHCLATTNVPQLGYFLVGQKGANGKSTLTEAISRFLGKKNINSSSLEQLEEDSHKFIAASKLANLADDVDGSYIQSANMYKTFTAGSSVSVRQLYHNSMVVKPYCTMISSCNIMPIFKEVSGGMDRRMVIIPFRQSVPEKDRDPRLIDKLSTEDAKTVWLNLAIEGLRYIRENNGVPPKCSAVEVENLQYKIKRDTVLGFLYDKCEIEIANVDYAEREKNDEKIIKKILSNSIDTLYTDYTSYCVDEGISKATHKNSFITKIQQTYGLDVRTFDGRKEFREHKKG